MLAKMVTDEEYIYTRYFCNSVMEFFYFVIIYIESYGFIFLTNLGKHIKFFKNEVTDLVMSFSGNTFEEKLLKMLTVNGFAQFENKITMNKKLSLKSYIFKDLIISKTVDLVLKGSTSVDDISKNLNLNNVIAIDKEKLSDLLEKSSHFEVKNNHSVSILHIHGILGFEDYVCSLIVNYFQNILYNVQTLSYSEIGHHTHFISYCGLHNMLGILCILYCSDKFICRDGQVMLNKKSEKYPKQKLLSMDFYGETSSPIAHVGKIIYAAYGSCIQKWKGEIGCLNKSSGYINCVIDFSDGNQGILSVYFNKSALKVISEVDDLKKYLQVRDAVEFDAVYYDNRRLDNYWIASRVKILKAASITYDEYLFDKLKVCAEIERKNCAENKCCLKNNSNSLNCFHIPNNNMARNSYQKEVNTEEILFSKSIECDSSAQINSAHVKSSTRLDIANKCTSLNQKPFDAKMYVSNLHLPAYLILFGHVFMLMADKGVAIAKQGDKLYTILFVRESIYPPNKSQFFFTKGQKILALIPFTEEVESLVIATFVYGLDMDEVNITEENCTSATEFTFKTLLPNISRELTASCGSSYCNIVNSLTFQPRNFFVNSQILMLYDFIVSQYNIAFDKIKLLFFLSNLCTGYSCKLQNNCSMYPLIKLSKRIKIKYAAQGSLQVKCRNFKKLQSTFSDKADLKVSNNLKEIRSSSSEKDITENKLLTNAILRVKSLDFKDESSTSSYISFSSYISCSSFETFYSCSSNGQNLKSSESLDERINSLNDNNGTEQNCNLDFSCDLRQETIFPTVPSNVLKFALDSLDQCPDSQKEKNEFQVQYSNVKNARKNDFQVKYRKNDRYKSLLSFPFLKHISLNKKRIHTQKILKPLCDSCHKGCVKTTACISMITNSLFFYNVNINNHSVILPCPKRIIPEKLQDKIKLNSCNEITVILNPLLNFSHILNVSMMS